jgi:hypothetical protein
MPFNRAIAAFVFSERLAVMTIFNKRRNGGAILEYQAARLATLLEEVRRFDLNEWMRAAPLPSG